jgi:predicted DNA-binding transcriptional regulator YafY
MNSKSSICSAIQNRSVISFYYKGHWRKVEPYTFGVHRSTSNTLLSAYQIDGYSESRSIPSWRLFDLHYIEGIVIHEQSFEGYRKGYNPNDSRMGRIFCTVV